MTAVDLDALDKLRGAATPGPWATVTRGGQCSATSEWWAEYGVACGGKPEFTVGDDEDAHADAALIVAAVNALPDLIAALRAVQERVQQWRQTSSPLGLQLAGDDLHKLITAALDGKP